MGTAGKRAPGLVLGSIIPHAEGGVDHDIELEDLRASHWISGGTGK
jgi:hypothetical protein